MSTRFELVKCPSVSYIPQARLRIGQIIQMEIFFPVVDGTEKNVIDRMVLIFGLLVMSYK